MIPKPRTKKVKERGVERGKEKNALHHLRAVVAAPRTVVLDHLVLAAAVVPDQAPLLVLLPVLLEVLQEAQEIEDESEVAVRASMRQEDTTIKKKKGRKIGIEKGKEIETEIEKETGKRTRRKVVIPSLISPSLKDGQDLLLRVASVENDLLFRDQQKYISDT